MSEVEIMNFNRLPSQHDFVLDQFCPHANGTFKDGYLKGLKSNGRFCYELKDLRKGFQFSLKEIEDATNGLAIENVVGSGDHGIVYLGLLPDNRRVAVKRLACDSRQPEELFTSQMEAIRHVKHKTLVKLLGCCTEGAYRILVSEYVDNGNLHHWLHGFPGPVSSLTWKIRLNIISGVAKGYVNPDCHSTSTLTEGNDIYSFGILIMEIISGKVPLYNNQSQSLIVQWFKSMIYKGKVANVVDPKLPEMPSSKELKRIILVALRCVDPDVNPRLKMGAIVRMLETDLLLFYEHKIVMEHCEHDHFSQRHAPGALGDTHLGAK
ncbi:unnamed protein product [Lupinus luteus]|uniref:non-specific serine/threonine protein kinase n=1 Tax=Lupinus luteus TaxID=3873 RepID=A0AAV1W2L5_LUPLU